jgi:2-isopropylmalate synthase
MAITHPASARWTTTASSFRHHAADGEQSPGFSMNLEEKLRMAEALASSASM